MKCNRCGRDNCRSLFEHVRDDRTAGPDWQATARAFEDCASATLDRALRAESANMEPRCRHCGDAFERVKYVTYYATFAAWECGCGCGVDAVEIERTEALGY